MELSSEELGGDLVVLGAHKHMEVVRIKEQIAAVQMHLCPASAVPVPTRADAPRPPRAQGEITTCIIQLGHGVSTGKSGYVDLLGTSPVVVFQSRPFQSPLQAQSQSVSEMIFFCAATNAGIGHIPSASSGHPSMPVRGATASFITTRICSLSREGQESTVVLQISRT